MYRAGGAAIARSRPCAPGCAPGIEAISLVQRIEDEPQPRQVAGGQAAEKRGYLGADTAASRTPLQPNDLQSHRKRRNEIGSVNRLSVVRQRS